MQGAQHTPCIPVYISIKDAPELWPTTGKPFTYNWYTCMDMCIWAICFVAGTVQNAIDMSFLLGWGLYMDFIWNLCVYDFYRCVLCNKLCNNQVKSINKDWSLLFCSLSGANLEASHVCSFPKISDFMTVHVEQWCV